MLRWRSRRSKSSSGGAAKTFPSGIKLLHNVDDSLVDIIFIHGLNGDREKTWTAKGATKPWPQILLPTKLPKARILTYGYDASVVGWKDWKGVVSENRIGDHAMNLLATISNYRDEDGLSERAIIFVCHSLGGLVCQDALVTAQNYPEKYICNVLNCTHGILFLGTPHQGSDLAKGAERLAKAIGVLKQTNSQILKVLKSESEDLLRISKSFHTMIRSQNEGRRSPIRITCFYEELPLPGIGVVVSSRSAIIPGYTSLGLRCNHMDMARCVDEEDPVFANIAGELCRWVTDLTTSNGPALPSSSTTFGNNQQQQQQIRSQASLQTRAERYFSVPYADNPHFVGRVTILEKLKDLLRPALRQSSVPTQARAALFGLGGVGKTQIALSLSYWVRKDCTDISVFWVHAGNSERFRDDYAQIAKSFQIPGCQDAKADMLMLVRNWLEKEHRKPWLMVVDNADDAELFFESKHSKNVQSPGCKDHLNPLSRSGLSKYIPGCVHGVIVVTTRNKQVGLKLARSRRVIEVRLMDQTDSSQLIKTKLEDENAEDDEMLLLADRLEYLPLALVQATAFIRENSITIGKYLRMLDQSDQNLVKLLSQHFDEDGRDSDSQNAVAKTWIISFKQIQGQSPLAGELLSLMSFFDRQDIPRKFFEQYCRLDVSNDYGDDDYGDYDGGISENDEDNDDIDHNDDDETDGSEATYQIKDAIELEKALGVIKAFSFASESEQGDSLTMHRLTQLMMREWLTTERKAGKWANVSLHVLSDLFPWGKYENWTVCRRYLPHAFAVIGHTSHLTARADALASVELQYNLSWFMKEQGQLKKAEELAVTAVKLQKQELGDEHANTLDSENCLALIYWQQGRLEEAEKLDVAVLEKRKRTLGNEHSATILTMNNLAGTYLDQGRLEDAEELHSRVVELKKRTLGDNDLDTLTSLNNLAAIYNRQGRLEETEKLHLQVLETQKRILGGNHPDTLFSMYSLACTWIDMGRCHEAAHLTQECVIKQEQVLGLDHLDTLKSMALLAFLYYRQDRPKEAEELEVKVLKKRRQLLGDSHRHTLHTMHNLACTWRHLGRYQEAVNLMQGCVLKSERVLGPNHPDTVSSRDVLNEWLEEENGNESEASDSTEPLDDEARSQKTVSEGSKSVNEEVQSKPASPKSPRPLRGGAQGTLEDFGPKEEQVEENRSGIEDHKSAESLGSKAESRSKGFEQMLKPRRRDTL